MAADENDPRIDAENDLFRDLQQHMGGDKLASSEPTPTIGESDAAAVEDTDPEPTPESIADAAAKTAASTETTPAEEVPEGHHKSAYFDETMKDEALDVIGHVDGDSNRPITLGDLMKMAEYRAGWDQEMRNDVGFKDRYLAIMDSV